MISFVSFDVGVCDCVYLCLHWLCMLWSCHRFSRYITSAWYVNGHWSRKILQTAINLEETKMEKKIMTFHTETEEISTNKTLTRSITALRRGRLWALLLWNRKMSLWGWSIDWRLRLIATYIVRVGEGVQANVCGTDYYRVLTFVANTCFFCWTCDTICCIIPYRLVILRLIDCSSNYTYLLL